ncbi:hypothetical protein [Nonomuraea sp. NPDC049709]|uniref:hypothetical protein n=1 Tax=Nonomuraea sp. NPDC049709 TaxID=3154736 RepID=UPI00343699B5
MHRISDATDLVDFGRNPAAPEFGRYGMLNVRYGKAKKGQHTQRQNVLSAVKRWPTMWATYGPGSAAQITLRHGPSSVADA